MKSTITFDKLTDKSTIQLINQSTSAKALHLPKIPIVMKILKSLLFLFAAVAIISSCKNNYANNTSSENDAAIKDSANFTTIQWLDTVKDMGTVTEGQKLEVNFRFRNSGDKPLVIERVTPTCGCTVADPPKEPIAPGKEGEIKGVFDSNGRIGPNHKTLTVVANTKPSQEKFLVFNVIVNKKAEK